MFKNEHPSCGCPQCRRGKHSKSGRYTVKAVTRRLRRLYRLALRRPDDAEAIRTPTPYTD